MSSKKTPMEESEQEANLAIAQQQDTDDESELNDIADKVAETLVHNPAVLERVMNDPGVIGVQHQTSMFPIAAPSMLADYEDILPSGRKNSFSD